MANKLVAKFYRVSIFHKIVYVYSELSTESIEERIFFYNLSNNPLLKKKVIKNLSIEEVAKLEVYYTLDDFKEEFEEIKGRLSEMNNEAWNNKFWGLKPYESVSAVAVPFTQSIKYFKEQIIEIGIYQL